MYTTTHCDRPIRAFVVDKCGKPRAPITKRGHVNRLLRNGMAKVVVYNPLTLQLTRDVHTKIYQ